MVYELITLSWINIVNNNNNNLVCDTVIFKNSKYLGKIVLRLFTTFVVVAAILASPKRRVFIWSYRSSIYRVHWVEMVVR